jgi:2-keto-4-pentenoate hydratase
VLPLLGRGVFGLMARVREIAQALEIVLWQCHEGVATPWPAPAVALNAANERLAIVIGGAPVSLSALALDKIGAIPGIIDVTTWIGNLGLVVER